MHANAYRKKVRSQCWNYVGKEHFPPNKKLEQNLMLGSCTVTAHWKKVTTLEPQRTGAHYWHTHGTPFCTEV